MYRNIKEYELRYTDVDAYDNLKISSLLALLEESACLSADELGFGYEALVPQHLGFIIANCYVKLNRQVKLGEKLSVHTWPIKPRHTIFFRDYELYCGEKLIGAATTRWCMINTDSYAIMPPSAFFSESAFDDYNTERSILFNGWKIPSPVCDKPLYSKKVTFSDYDHNFHLNNTKYADILTDALEMNIFRDKDLSSVQITYVKQCKLGEVLDVYVSEAEGKYLLEGKVKDETRVQMRLGFDEV